jgi:predicted dehydrogenase
MAQTWIDDNIKEQKFPSSVARSIRGYDSIHNMLNEVELNALYVATPPGAHLEVIRQIVNTRFVSKLKAIYVEKPCGRCAWETRAIIDELSRKNIKFFPAYVSLAHERIQKIRELLKNQIIGDKVIRIQYTQRGTSFARGLNESTGGVKGTIIPWRLVAKQSGGGLIMDMGCHILSRIDYLFGPIVNVKSTVLRKGGQRHTDSTSPYPLIEDYVSMNASIGHCDWSAISTQGARVECLWDFSSDSSPEIEVDEFIIEGSKGSLQMGGMGAGLPIKVLNADGTVVHVFEFDPPEHSAQPLIQLIADELNDSQDAECTATAANAARTSEVLDSILNGYYGGRHDEFWSREETWPGLE